MSAVLILFALVFGALGFFFLIGDNIPLGGGFIFGALVMWAAVGVSRA